MKLFGVFGMDRIMIVQVLVENIRSGDNSMTYIHIKEDHTFIRS